MHKLFAFDMVCIRLYIFSNFNQSIVKVLKNNYDGQQNSRTSLSKIIKSNYLVFFIFSILLLAAGLVIFYKIRVFNQSNSTATAKKSSNVRKCENVFGFFIRNCTPIFHLNDIWIVSQEFLVQCFMFRIFKKFLI